MSKSNSTNVDLNKMFSKDSATDNLEMVNHNLKDEMYQAEINQNMNIILNKFKLKANKNPNDKMSKDEVVSFLDSLLPDGKKFDRGIVEKILNVLDETSDTITVSEFAKTYIQIVEELKLNIHEVQTDFQSESNNLENYKKLAFENKNEKLNSEGINEAQAKFFITINSLQFTDPNEMKPGVAIVLKFENDVQKTSKQNSGYVWNQKFEFKILRKNFIIFELISNDNKLGEIRFHLNAVDTQEEYEVVLDVIEDSTKSTIAKINCKIKFVWSLYKLYQDLLNKAEKKINKYNTTIMKSNKIIDVLNDPFNFYQGGSKGLEMSQQQPGLGGEIFDLGVTKLFKKVMPLDKQVALADKIESMVKSRTHKDSIDWLHNIKMLALAVMAMGFLTTFTQANFVDFIVSGYMLLIIYTTINSNLLGYLNQFFGIAVIAFCYDLIWTGSDYDGGSENALKFIVFLVKLISLCTKLALAGSVWIYALKTDRDLHRSQYNESSVNANLN